MTLGFCPGGAGAAPSPGAVKSVEMTVGHSSSPMLGRQWVFDLPADKGLTIQKLSGNLKLGGRLARLVQSGELRGERGEALLLHLNGELEAPRLVAAGVGKHGEVEEPCRVTVQIPPAALSIAVAKSIPIQPGSETTVTVLVARDWYAGPVTVRGRDTSGGTNRTGVVVRVR